MTQFIKPPALHPGDRVSVVAPSGPFPLDVFEKGLGALASRYAPHHEEGLFARARYLAGDDARRSGELNAALRDPESHGVFAARGGYGVMRLLTRVNPALYDPSTHKAVVGFSDITALHLALQAQGRVSFHAPVLTQLGRQTKELQHRLWRLLEDTERPRDPLQGTETFVAGAVEGPLIGGNLAVLTRLLGTPFMPDLRGALLLLEDVGERPYRLDRMWTHLQLAGVFDNDRGGVAGIVLGEFTLCEERDADYGPLDVLRELAREAAIPCAAGFPIGHGEINEPVPLGVRARLHAPTPGSGGEAPSLTFLEPAVVERTA